MIDVINKARVVLTSVVTVLTALAFAATQVADQAEVPVVGSYAGQAATFLIAAIAIIRRVTPVAEAERGL
jgi:hypothetical protein